MGDGIAVASMAKKAVLRHGQGLADAKEGPDAT